MDGAMINGLKALVISCLAHDVADMCPVIAFAQ